MKKNAWVYTVLFLSVPLTALGCATERTVVHEPAARVVVVNDTPVQDKVIIVKKRPPSPRREVKPRRPSVRHVWAGGYWSWRGHNYVWVSGKWVVPPRTKARWVAGHWKKHHGGWVWVVGHWRY